jgi:hypothetical protein
MKLLTPYRGHNAAIDSEADWPGGVNVRAYPK